MSGRRRLYEREASIVIILKTSRRTFKGCFASNLDGKDRAVSAQISLLHRAPQSHLGKKWSWHLLIGNLVDLRSTVLNRGGV
ncbi:hypothetical protein QCA50_020311 [Cerrena zonata]|uniref:Uncharacterized protein n=1 Tax=Cerrena zonata TaxID=2478898 RepID=A0AAW0FJC4_9APHY